MLQFEQITDLAKGKNIYITGIIFKKMKKQLSYLKEIETPEYEEFHQVSHQNICSVEDKILFEDHSGRVELDKDNSFADANLEKFTLDDFCTGSVATLRIQAVDGVMKVSEVLLLNDSDRPKSSSPDYRAIFIANLQLSRDNLMNVHTQLLRNFLLQGNEFVKRSSGVVCFGGIMSELKDVNLEAFGSLQFENQFKAIQEDMDQQTIYIDSLIKKFFEFEENMGKKWFLASSLNDPISSSLPQPKLSHILFPSLGGEMQCELLKNPEILTFQKESVLLLDG